MHPVTLFRIFARNAEITKLWMLTSQEWKQVLTSGFSVWNLVGVLQITLPGESGPCYSHHMRVTDFFLGISTVHLRETLVQRYLKVVAFYATIYVYYSAGNLMQRSVSILFYKYQRFLLKLCRSQVNNSLANLNK